MKNGLMIYSPNKYGNFNIGDYIQSIAARQFFDKIDIYVNREKLNKYRSEEIKLIMNGWFMNDPDNWPPSDKIFPLLISFHINNWTKERLLTEKGLAFFKQNEPIGCRDLYTTHLLQSKGINAYFSGCLTLTLNLTYNRLKSNNKIYFVEPYYKLTRKNKFEIIKSFIVFILKSKTINTLNDKITGINSLTYKLKTAFFYISYSRLFEKDVILNAEYIYQIFNIKDFDNEDDKFQYANNLLKKYCKAQFIVTSRIHCALPCLGIGIPVLYVNNESQIKGSSSRLKGILDLLHVINYNKGNLSINMNLNGEKIGKNFKFSNKNIHQQYSNKMIRICNKYTNIQ